MKSFLWIVVIVVFASPAILAADVATEDQAKFQGEWRALSLGEGKGDDLAKFRCTFKNKTVKFAADDKTTVFEAEFTLDASENPKAIHFVAKPEEGAKKPERLEGIYRFEGNLLLICIALGEKKPADFQPKEGEHLLVLEKIPQKKN